MTDGGRLGSMVGVSHAAAAPDDVTCMAAQCADAPCCGSLGCFLAGNHPSWEEHLWGLGCKAGGCY